jgi:N-acetylneuraminic acid mutarotase
MIKVGKLSLLLLMLTGVLFSSSCSDDPEETEETIGNWTKVTPYRGRPRSGAAQFTIGNTAFVGLGYDGDDYLSDVYSFNKDEGFWEKIKSFPGTPREKPVAFSVAGKGYVGLGYNRELDQEELGDWWEYDPDSDTWTQLSDFSGTARYNAIAFSIGSKGYVGTGYDGDNYNSDFWEYDPADDSWKEIKSYPGEKIEEGLAFVINDQAYVCAGRNNGIYNNDFWKYDPSTTLWTKLVPSSEESYFTDFKNAVRRHDAAAVAVNNNAYIIGGIASSGATDASVYEFNAGTLEWRKMTSFEGAARSAAVSFSLDNLIFMGTGLNGSRRFDDMWEFKPGQKYNEEN